MGTRYLEYTIAGVILGLVLHGIWWLLGTLPFISYGGLFSGTGWVVWVVSILLAAVLIHLMEEGWRKTVGMWAQWAVTVGAIYAVAIPVVWYFKSQPDAPLASWLTDTGRNLVNYWDEDLAYGWKVTIAILAFIAFFTVVPFTFYIVWSSVKGIFRKVVPNKQSTY